MSGIQSGPARNLDCLLEEGIQITGELYRLEEEVQRLLISMDFQGLAAAVEAGAEILRRGEWLIERKRKLAEEKPLRELIELQLEGVERSSQLDRYELLLEKLSAVKARQEVNRRLAKGGSQIVFRMQNILSAGKTTYNCRGEIRSASAGIRPGLDQNC